MFSGEDINMAMSALDNSDLYDSPDLGYDTTLTEDPTEVDLEGSGDFEYDTDTFWGDEGDAYDSGGWLGDEGDWDWNMGSYDDEEDDDDSWWDGLLGVFKDEDTWDFLAEFGLGLFSMMGDRNKKEVKPKKSGGGGGGGGGGGITAYKAGLTTMDKGRYVGR